MRAHGKQSISSCHTSPAQSGNVEFNSLLLRSPKLYFTELDPDMLTIPSCAVLSYRSREAQVNVEDHVRGPTFGSPF